MQKQYPLSVKFLTSLMWRHKKRAVIFVGNILIGAWLSLVLPYIAKIETDQLVAQSPELRGIVTSPFGIFALILWVGFLVEMIQYLIRTILQYFEEKHEQDFETAYFIELYSRLKNIELGVYANPKNQDLFSKILWENGLVK